MITIKPNDYAKIKEAVDTEAMCHTRWKNLDDDEAYNQWISSCVQLAARTSVIWEYLEVSDEL